MLAPLLTLSLAALSVPGLRQETPMTPSTKGVLGEPSDTMGLRPLAGADVMISKGFEPKGLRLEKDAKAAIPWKFDRRSGVLEIVVGSGDVCTRQPYGDFRLHLEFATPKNDNPWGNNGNSGIYIQRRYEVQILNSHDLEAQGRKISKQDCGALYQQRLPAVNAARPAGEWQTYDIVFRGARFVEGKKVSNARITVHHNGQVIHDDVEFSNKTGAGKQEGPEPDFIRLQEHGNTVKFRNFWVLPLKG